MGIFSWLFKGRGNNAGMKTAQEVRGTITPYDQGVAYYRGIGVEQDYSKAFYYLKLADEMGVPEASCFLGEMYEYGNCVEKDVEKAIKLLTESSQKLIESQMFLLCYYVSINDDEKIQEYKSMVENNPKFNIELKKQVENILKKVKKNPKLKIEI